MARLIKSSGEIIQNVDISNLESMQALVGGHVEFVYLKKGKILICNEEGLLRDFKHNIKASEIYGHPLVGDIVECSSSEVN
jgi:hypothetical protein